MHLSKVVATGPVTATVSGLVKRPKCVSLLFWLFCQLNILGFEDLFCSILFLDEEVIMYGILSHYVNMSITTT